MSQNKLVFLVSVSLAVFFVFVDTAQLQGGPRGVNSTRRGICTLEVPWVLLNFLTKYSENIISIICKLYILYDWRKINN